MKKSFPLALALVSFLLGGVVTTALTRTAWSQNPVKQPNPAAPFARYQLTVSDVNDIAHQYLVDTATGRVWVRYEGGVKSAWQEQGPDFSKRPVTAGP